MGRVIFLGGSIKVVLNNGFCIFKLSSFTKHRSTLGRSLHHTITWFANPSRGSKCPKLSWQSTIHCEENFLAHSIMLSRQRNWTYSWPIRFWPKYTRFYKKTATEGFSQVYSHRIGYFSKTNHSSLIHYENLMTLFHHE